MSVRQSHECRQQPRKCRRYPGKCCRQFHDCHRHYPQVLATLLEVSPTLLDNFRTVRKCHRFQGIANTSWVLPITSEGVSDIFLTLSNTFGTVANNLRSARKCRRHCCRFRRHALPGRSLTPLTGFPTRSDSSKESTMYSRADVGDTCASVADTPTINHFGDT